MSASWRAEKLSSWIQKKAAFFLSSNIRIKNGIIAANRVELNKNLTKAAILITVYPEKEEKETISRLRALKKDFTEYIKKDFRGRKLPSFEFAIDEGEKKRIKIEELLAR